MIKEMIKEIFFVPQFWIGSGIAFIISGIIVFLCDAYDIR